MVAIDFCLNETSRHADVLLPGTLALEHDQYDLLFNPLAIRNVARYSAPVLRPPASGREDWQILLELATGIARRTSGLRAPAPWYGGGVPAAVHPSPDTPVFGATGVNFSGIQNSDRTQFFSRCAPRGTR